MRLSKLLYQSSFLFITFLSYGCIIDQNTKRDIIKIQKKYIPDKSLGVFEITLSKNLISNSISGYTSDSSAYTDMKIYSDSMNINFKVILLPEQSLQDSIYGIVNVSVTPLKEEPSHKSQMVDQALMGYPVKLLRKVDEWYLCQTHYGYIGWINKTAIYKGTKKDKNEWESLAIYKVSKMNSSVYSKPRIGSDPVNDLVLNNQLIVLKKLLKWCEISLPDGRKGFVKSSDLTKNNNKQKKLNVNHLLKYAKNMMGVPYIWGGNSTKGNDCSGFTQTVFNTQNIQLPRDARQQALLGTEIPLEKSKPGDLFFFGNDNKIKHVGICINGKDFIHQGGKVAINSLDPNSIRFDSHRKETFLFVKRIKS